MYSRENLKTGRVTIPFEPRTIDGFLRAEEACTRPMGFWVEPVGNARKSNPSPRLDHALLKNGPMSPDEESRVLNNQSLTQLVGLFH